MRERLANLEEFARESGYLDAMPMDAWDTVAIMPLLYTHAIIVY